MTDLEKARCILQEGGYTCVLCKGDALRTSTKRGVAPLMALWEEQADVACFSAADKVVGKATALLYRLLGVKAVYAGIISESALETLRLGDIETEYGALVPYIVNREGTGRCPMETATADLDDPRLAPTAIKSKLAELMAKDRK